MCIRDSHNMLAEKRHITKKELDEIIPNNPIIIHHKSGHSGVLNSKGLELSLIHIYCKLNVSKKNCIKQASFV